MGRSIESILGFTGGRGRQTVYLVKGNEYQTLILDLQPSTREKRQTQRKQSSDLTHSRLVETHRQQIRLRRRYLTSDRNWQWKD